MSERLWNSFTSQLLDMKQESQIDLSILSIIASLIQTCQEKEFWWANNEIKPIENNFAPYHAFRNIRLILHKIEDQLRTAKERNSNPKEVDNALAIIPTMSSLYFFVDSLKDHSIDTNLKSNIYSRSRYVRDIAYNYSFLPSLEDEIKGINKTKLRSRISRISKNVREETVI